MHKKYDFHTPDNLMILALKHTSSQLTRTVFPSQISISSLIIYFVSKIDVCLSISKKNKPSLNFFRDKSRSFRSDILRRKIYVKLALSLLKLRERKAREAQSNTGLC